MDKLKAEIKDLHSCILSKEKEVYKISAEKEKSKNSLLAKITHMQKEIAEFNLLNGDLKTVIHKKESTIQNQCKEIEDLKVLVNTQDFDNSSSVKQNLQVPQWSK